MTDNVERLRDYSSNPMVQSEYSMVPARELLESADEIERLREQNEKLRHELAVWLECYKSEKQQREELVKRVREALGE